MRPCLAIACTKAKPDSGWTIESIMEKCGLGGGKQRVGSMSGLTMWTIDMQYPENNQPIFSAAILAPSAARRAALTALAAECGCQIRNPEERADFLLVDFCSKSEEAFGESIEFESYIERDVTEILVWAPLDYVDTAYAMLWQHDCHFIVEAGDWPAVPILSGAFRQVTARLVHERARDGEMGALNRISNELADFARTLARIAEQDRDTNNNVQDKPIGFRHASPDSFRPIIQPTGRNTTFEARHVRELIKLRRMRDRLLGADLFADPGWDILLDLFAAQEEGQQVSVSSLCIAAAVPPTTALRWITNMTEAGYLVRRQDPNDARRVYIELSDLMSAKLRDYFETIADRAIMPI